LSDLSTGDARSRASVRRAIDFSVAHDQTIALRDETIRMIVK